MYNLWVWNISYHFLKKLLEASRHTLLHQERPYLQQQHWQWIYLLVQSGGAVFAVLPAEIDTGMDTHSVVVLWVYWLRTRSDVEAFTVTILQTRVPPWSFAVDVSFTASISNSLLYQAIVNPAWTFQSSFSNKWTPEHLRETVGSKVRFFALPYFFRDTWIPVLDPDKAAISIVVSGVTDIEWPAWVPERGGRPWMRWVVNWDAIFSMISSSGWSEKWPVKNPIKKLLLNSLVLNTSLSQNCILGMECLSNYQQETNADQVKPRPPLITDHIYKGPILVWHVECSHASYASARLASVGWMYGSGMTKLYRR